MKQILKIVLLSQIITLFYSSAGEQTKGINSSLFDNTFKFILQIVDESNNPIENALVHILIKDGTSAKAKTVFDTSFTKTNQDIFEKSIVIDNSICLLYYDVQKVGYCSSIGSIRKDDATAKPTKEPIYFITLNKPSITEIDFNFLCVGVNDRAIPNIGIKYSVIVNDSVIHFDSTVSDNSGIAKAKVLYKISCDDLGKQIKKRIKVESEGYYTSEEIMRGSAYNNIDYFELKFISKKDFFDPDFIISKDYRNLKNKIIGFIDLLQLKSLLTNSILEYYSINIIEFKSKRYLTFDFNHTNEYNSLQLDKYEIAKRIFDEVIRKVLNPLNDNLENSKEFEGYKLMVKTRTRSFTDEKDRSEELIFEFYIPKNTVKSYKNLDITGQQVLDNSIILLNSERIDLKLQ